tara:strand:+ start:3093 stop:3239 length:147 start_codon:yes stop_codon:yes gene_type:complete
MIEIEELTSELIAFLDSKGQYNEAVNWMEERGYDRDKAEDSIAEYENF